jgi:hypothetical protein
MASKIRARRPRVKEPALPVQTVTQAQAPPAPTQDDIHRGRVADVLWLMQVSDTFSALPVADREFALAMVAVGSDYFADGCPPGTIVIGPRLVTALRERPAVASLFRAASVDEYRHALAIRQHPDTLLGWSAVTIRDEALRLAPEVQSA